MTEQMTRYDRRMFELMNRPEAAVLYATARRRRLVVAAHIVLTLASLAAWLGTVLGESAWVMYALLALLLPWCVATGVINAATRGLLELRHRALDERQIADKRRVVTRAHRLTTWVLLAAAAGVGALTWLGEVDTEALAFPVLFAVFVVHWIAPLWVAGLTVADGPVDDEVVGDEAAASPPPAA
ncbi:hypothetical protein [Streptomyces jeddahensis]|uniref:Uncharacterized protein n=1 Tax=Streptomyces jeddahensis TaxID=1716141 RepID=A0A177HRT1_9ACTN|nr:hypothetical protein [Streptomyces jeddahensis]OAH13147.1 hypothetical protein STSP_34720 [Streptomyces jeddahensis]